MMYHEKMHKKSEAHYVLIYVDDVTERMFLIHVKYGMYSVAVVQTMM